MYEKYYYVDKAGQRQGPLEPEQLKGVVTPETMVWTTGMADWKPAGQVGNLAFLFSTMQYGPAAPEPPTRPAEQQPPKPGQQPPTPGQQPQMPGQTPQAPEEPPQAPGQQPQGQGQQQQWQQPQESWYTPGYGTPHPEREVIVKPSTYIVWSILSTIFICTPFGIVAIVYSALAMNYNDQGRFGEAEEASRKAKRWNWISLITALVVWGLYILFVVVFALAIIPFGAAASTF